MKQSGGVFAATAAAKAAAAIREESARRNGAAQSPAALENRLEALKVLSSSILREVEALNKVKEATMPNKIDLAQEVQRFETDLIRCALVRTGGRQRQAARLLNVKVTTLNAKIKRYGIPVNGLLQENKM